MTGAIYGDGISREEHVAFLNDHLKRMNGEEFLNFMQRVTEDNGFTNFQIMTTMDKNSVLPNVVLTAKFGEQQ